MYPAFVCGLEIANKPQEKYDYYDFSNIRYAQIQLKTFVGSIPCSGEHHLTASERWDR